MKNYKKRNFFLVWGIGSFFVHTLFLSTSLISSKFSEQLEDLKEKTIEIISPEDLSENKKQVVQTSQGETTQNSKGEAKYAGEFDQRVERQMQSPVQGSFQEGQVGRKQESPDLDSSQEDALEEKGLGLKEFMTFGRSPHALSQEIPFGNQTILNTDKVRYASFVNRIADEIYHPWVEAAEKAVREFVVGRRKMEPNLYVTRLRITLDDEGAVKGIQVLDSCGVSELDEAPKKAFWEMEPFPNPPHQLMENDGYVRLTYEFQFEWKNSVFNIIPWRI